MNLIPEAMIERRILLIRGQKVMLDADLAEVYGMPTTHLNEQVKRNDSRFPEDFVFQLNSEEKAEVVANCDHLEKLKFSKALPNVKLSSQAPAIRASFSTVRYYVVA